MFPLRKRPGTLTQNSAERGFTMNREEFPGEGLPAGGPDDDGTLLDRIKAWYRQDYDHWHQWQEDARGDYDFVSGVQWTEDEISHLKDALRPVVTFNRIGPFVDSVEGHEINNRTEVRYIPRQLGSAGVSEVFTAAGKWVRDECDAEDEETSAFLDCVTCGVGVTDTRMEYDTDPDGIPIVARVDPLEMLWDAGATKQNFADARRVMRIKLVTLDEARELYPDVSDDDLDAKWARQNEDGRQPHDAREAPFYRNDQSGEIDKQRQRVALVEVQWWEYEVAYRVLDPATGRMMRLTKDEVATLKQRVDTLNAIPGVGGKMKMPASVKDKRRKYWKAVVGNVVLDVDDGPDRGGFTFKAMTGKRDRNRGVWYGLVRGMKDPQRWANKFFAQTMHTINANAKGGLLAEQDAFQNPQEAADTWAQPDTITFTNPGALQNGKVQLKTPITYPNGLDKLMEYAVAAIPASAGINPEMMGQSTSQQPGVALAEIGRKQQVMAILAGLFNSKRRYTKEQGRLLLWMIQEFISDGRLIKVVGEEGAKYVPLTKQPGVAEYDVVVDDTPTSPNMKERVWAMTVQMLPMLQNMGLPPQLMMEFFKYSPFPEQLIEKFSAFIQQTQKQGPPPPSPTEQAGIQLAGAQAQKAIADAKKIEAEIATTPARMQMEVEKQSSEIEAKRATAIAQLAKVGLDARSLSLEEANAALDSLLAGHQQAHDMTMDHHEQEAAQAQAAQQTAQQGAT